MPLQTLIILIISYILLILGIGYWCSRRAKTAGDFFLGGRSIGPWMSALGFVATYFSAALFIRYAGNWGWQFGIHTMWIVIGNTVIGAFLAWRILAGRVRDMTARLNALTIPEFYGARFDSKPLRIVAALIVLLFLIPYSGAAHFGLAYLGAQVLAISREHILILLALLTCAYLVMGGYYAVVVGDAVRSIIEFVGAIIVVLVLTSLNGGPAHTWHALIDKMRMPALVAPESIIISTRLPVGGDSHFPGWVVLLALVIITSFSPWAMPHMLQRFCSIRRRADIRLAGPIALGMTLVIAFCVYYTGAMTHLLMRIPPIEVVGNGWLFIRVQNLELLMSQFLIQFAPLALQVLVVFLVFSAALSTLSSLALVASGAFSIDIIGAFINRRVRQSTIVTALRVGAIVFIWVSLLVSHHTLLGGELDLITLSWGALTAAFLAPLLFSLFWRRATGIGVLAGMLSGVAAAIALSMVWGLPNIPVACAVAIFVPFLIVPVVSWCTTPPSPERIREAFGYSEESASPASLLDELMG